MSRWIRRGGHGDELAARRDGKLLSTADGDGQEVINSDSKAASWAEMAADAASSYVAHMPARRASDERVFSWGQAFDLGLLSMGWIQGSAALFVAASIGELLFSTHILLSGCKTA